MPRAPARVSQADLTRALHAVARSGLRMRVEILPDGTIRLEPVDGREGAPVEYTGRIRL